MNCEDNWIRHWERQISSKIHQKKLETIKKRDIKPHHKFIYPAQTFRKINLDRSVEITRENRILYEKLVNISERKHAATVMKKNLNHSNLRYKKFEEDRIALENMHLVNKLSANNSELSLVKMIKDYETALEYKNRISKAKLQERISKSIKLTAKKHGFSPNLSSQIKSVSITPINSNQSNSILVENISEEKEFEKNQTELNTIVE